MVLSWIWTGMLLVSILAAIHNGTGGLLAAAAMQGAQSSVTLCISIAGALCLWSGIGKLMEFIGLTQKLANIIRPALIRIFPSAKTDVPLAGDLSTNICANLLGLGNAATPMGISAAKRLNKSGSAIASDELCRLIVLNTASIQLLPTNVAAIRSALGCSSPFDLLPAVWVASICSAGLGVSAAFLMGRLRK